MFSILGHILESQHTKYNLPDWITAHQNQVKSNEYNTKIYRNVLVVKYKRSAKSGQFKKILSNLFIIILYRVYQKKVDNFETALNLAKRLGVWRFLLMYIAWVLTV